MTDRNRMARRIARPGGKLVRLATGLLVLLALFLLGGFVQFAHMVATTVPAPGISADGIVALTGGESRIADAVALLRDGRGRRLLISGVHPDTTSEEIARMVSGSDGLFSCCIDLDHDALNTVGNAEVARNWASENGFGTLLVVTSAYHMPRSMMELSRSAPDLTLRPYPVRTERLALERWWTDQEVMRVMASEYAKYLLARLHMRLGKPSTTREATAAALAR
ncbi:MAG: YdcF family protein [Flavobacteriaceae bacterium]